jgi:hypothetical protein
VRYTFDFTKAAGHWMIEVHGKVWNGWEVWEVWRR